MFLHELLKKFDYIYITQRLKPTTANGYRVNIRLHILPYLGDKDILELSVDDLDALTCVLQNKGLCNRTIVYVHATLRKSLNFGIRRGFLLNNPYNQFDMPRKKRFEYVVLNENQIAFVLDKCRGTRIETAVILALCYGMRRGEILGIIPSDFDSVNGVLHIQRSRTLVNGSEVITDCKTNNSNRYVLISPRHYRLFSNVSQFSISPWTLDVLFHDFALSLGLPKGLRFHDLRHSYATLMLQKGINPKIVSQILGHSSVSVTLDIYSHPPVDVQSVCLDVFESVEKKKAPM